MTNKVNLFILGVQKCGTTSLSDILSAHSEVFVPSIKETYFFCLDENFERGEDWYEAEFFAPAKARAVRWRADATPFYLASPEAMARIANYAGKDARFIVMLRDPVKRAMSAHQHQQRLGHEELSFEVALEAEAGRIDAARAARGRWWRHAYVEVGNYGAQLEAAFDLLGRERVLVLRQDQLRDQGALQAQLTAFLDLSAPFPEDVKPHANPAAMPRSKLIRNLLTRQNSIKSLVRKLLPREIRTRIGTALNRANARAVPRNEIDPEIAAALGERFAPDQARLAALGLRSHET